MINITTGNEEIQGKQYLTRVYFQSVSYYDRKGSYFCNMAVWFCSLVFSEIVMHKQSLNLLLLKAFIEQLALDLPHSNLTLIRWLDAVY